MNVLKPELIWIEGRCYRVNDPVSEATALYEHDLYENDVIYTEMENEGDCDEDFEVELLDNSRYCTNFHVSKHYFGSVIGKKGAIKNRIERDTKTEIKIPRHGQDGNIFIFGAAPSNVKAARRRINIIVISSRMKQKFTHFVSIPMNNPAIMKSFDNFKDNVLRDCPSRGLEESLFISPSKLHLTIGVMCLMDNEERLFASKLLTDAKEKIIMPLLAGHLPLRVRLKGLSYMNDDPKEIDVLYGRVQEESAPLGLLQRMANELVEFFYKAGYMNKKEYGRDDVKLHVTLINTRYRNSSANDDNGEGKSKFTRESFDGSAILEKYGDYDFGVQEVTDIHLSQHHTLGSDGYYQPTCVVSCKAST